MQSSLAISIARCKPELIVPSKPTPYEFKKLSDIDDQKDLRLQINFIQFYGNHQGIQRRDPVKVIKEAIGEALVYYYPFAGRVRQAPNDKLVVECNGEGVIFIEADANMSLDQLGNVLQPPFPNDLLYNVPGSDGILNCPLMLIQVTRLLCGGFAFAIRVSHIMSDGAGVVQFMTALGEVARGTGVPSVKPIWKRELLNLRAPQKAFYIPRVYPNLHDTNGTPLFDVPQLTLRSYFVSLEEIEGLRKQLPPHLQKCPKFEVLIARLWQCRTIALNLNPNDEVHFTCPVNAREKFNPPLPVGFYGNAVGLMLAKSTVSKLCSSQLGYAVELIRRAKSDVMEELIQSSLELLAKRGGLPFTNMRTFFVSDLTRMDFKNIDFGWGKALYGGPKGESGLVAAGNFLVSSRNNKGKDGITAAMYLPYIAMERFSGVIKQMIKVPDNWNSSVVVPRL